MDENTGWISLHRKLVGSKLWLKQKFTKGQAWVDLLMLASFKETEIMIGYKTIKLSPGQIFTSQKKLSKRWKWGIASVHRFLIWMTSEKVLEWKAETINGGGYTVITILNWSEYQNVETQRKASGKLAETYNNVNNVNKIHTHMGGQKKLNVPELLNSKENSKKGLFACTPMELWEIAMYLQIPKEAAERKHNRIMRLINTGEFQIKYPKNKTTYNTLLDWLESDLEKGRLTQVDQMGLEVLKIQKPDAIPQF